jgi:methylisocitrate lyase
LNFAFPGNINLMPQSPGALLRQAVTQGTIQVPGAPNALTARLIEQLGFPAAYLSGAAVSAGVLALPDIGLMTLTELVQQTNYATRSVAIPVIVDADTGFGDALHVERTVFELERAGAAAIQLEDQQLPKRCGHLTGKTLVEVETMSAKIRAAVAARTDDDLVIVARTDARGVTDFDDAMARAKEYVAAGADWIFPEALTDRGEFARFADGIEVPLVANMTEFGKSPLLTVGELTELGYAAILYPVTLLRVAMQAARSALTAIADKGTQASLIDVMQTREELYQLLQYDTFDQRDRENFQTQRSS